MSTGESAPTEEELTRLLARTNELGHGCDMGEPDCAACKIEMLVGALRAARESARVATRERDEAQADAAGWKQEHENAVACWYRERDALAETIKGITKTCEAHRAEQERLREQAEAQLTDRDRMIAGLRDELAEHEWVYGHYGSCHRCRGEKQDQWDRPTTGGHKEDCPLGKALSTSHLIAAAHEGRIAKSTRESLIESLRAAEIATADARMIEAMKASCVDKCDHLARLVIDDENGKRICCECWAERAESHLRTHEETIGRLTRALKTIDGKLAVAWKSEEDGDMPDAVLDVGKILRDALAAAPPNGAWRTWWCA
jgi:hypothetical protein